MPKRHTHTHTNTHAHNPIHHRSTSCRVGDICCCSCNWFLRSHRTQFGATFELTFAVIERRFSQKNLTKKNLILEYFWENRRYCRPFSDDARQILLTFIYFFIFTVHKICKVISLLVFPLVTSKHQIG